jgi:hypothetical protein
VCEALGKTFEAKKLKSLTLVDPAINPVHSDMLLKTIEQNCKVEKMALIKFTWTEKSWKSFCSYFREDVMLEDIDISYSIGLSPE